MNIQLTVRSAGGEILAQSQPASFPILVYEKHYRDGDEIVVTTDAPGFCELRLEDTMLPALVYLTEKKFVFPVPFGEKKLIFSPKSFTGEKHMLSARAANGAEIYARRNLALNPYDHHGSTGCYPHTSANIETRGEAVFAARNTVDGIFANEGHGAYPYQSWGINRRPDAELKLELGCAAELDEIRLTLRADFPHDSYWTEATLCFSDGSSLTMPLDKSLQPQSLQFEKRRVEWIVIKNLVKAEDESPFPALSQLEVYGRVCQ